MTDRAALPEPAAVLPGEASILAQVVSDLSDETTKLVYADWLQEHDDPRGPFLREFLAAVRTGEPLPQSEGLSKPWRDLVGVTITEAAGTHGFADRIETFLKVALPTIRVTPSDAPVVAPPIARSRYGGRPDLPADVEWPRWTNGKPLTFLGQIDLADLTGSVVARELPPAGLLSAFYYLNENDDDLYGGPRRDGDGNETGSEGWRLFYFPPGAVLRLHDDSDAPTWSRFQSHPLTFDERIELTFDRNGWYGVSELEGAEWDRYVDLVSSVNAHDECGDRLLGHFQSDEWATRFGRTGRSLWSIGLTGNRPGLWGDFLTRLHILIASGDLHTRRFDRAGLEAEWLCS